VERGAYSSAIRNINMTIGKGKFVVLLGDIGSGKSSLLYAILNEMKSSHRTTITLSGDIAFSAQQPCIISGTVRDNILFTLPYEKRKFEEALYFASLRQDLKVLVKGEFTEIGEKGTNLSGGQKARISLARAIYSGREILFLDDIVSAVDVHVAEFIVREALLGHLRGKTIVMPTHAANFAEYADEVIVLRRGVITRKGHFRDICHTAEFQEVYEEAMKRQSGGENTGENRKINLDQKKIKETIGYIQSKRSMIKNSTTKSFAEKAIEELIIPEDHNRGDIDLTVLREYIQQNGGAVFMLLVLGAMAGWLSLSILSNI
jgi:ATP-binding cassette, subfamily C (CFTR/MRP), member 1